MSEKINKTEVLRLETPVVVRKVPMTAQGCDMLRAIREYQSEEYGKRHECDVEIPFPTSIHLLMQEFCHLKGIHVK